MNKRRYIVDIFRDLVAQVNTNLLPQLSAYDANIQEVSYEFGHPLEIIETLIQKDQSGEYAFKKYPLIALFTDITEEKGILGYYSRARINVMVIMSTVADYKAKQRLDIVFKPVIHPIVDELLRLIADSPYFADYDADQIKRNEVDRFYWGRAAWAANTGLRMVDHLDATELQLTINTDPFCILTAGAGNI